MSAFMKCCSVPLLLLLTAATVHGQDSQEARAILEKVSQASQTGRSYRAEFTGSIESKGSGLQQKVDLAGTVTFQRPDKLRMEMKMGPAEILMVRDGAQTWIYMPDPLPIGQSKLYRTFLNGRTPTPGKSAGCPNCNEAKPALEDRQTLEVIFADLKELNHGASFNNAQASITKLHRGSDSGYIGIAQDILTTIANGLRSMVADRGALPVGPETGGCRAERAPGRRL
jgi:outer membrane lipoprotein-sorting protein